MITEQKLQERPLSYSSLKEFAKSPAHYIEYLRKQRTSTPATLFGSMVHCLLLEPAKFNEQFAVMKDIDRRTKDGKEEYAKFLEESKGKEVVANDQYMDAVQLVNKAFSQKHIHDAIGGCFSYEKEWKKEIHGLPFRGFFDGEAEDYILEIKTANDASPKTIIRDFFDRSYHIQAALYNQVSGGKNIKYVIIETKPPYTIALASPTQEFIDKGISDIERLANSFKVCMENELWDMSYEYYNEGEFIIDLPSWVK